MFNLVTVSSSPSNPRKLSDLQRGQIGRSAGTRSLVMRIGAQGVYGVYLDNGTPTVGDIRICEVINEPVTITPGGQ